VLVATTRRGDRTGQALYPAPINQTSALISENRKCHSALANDCENIGARLLSNDFSSREYSHLPARV
jgi:hypothetical protein